LRGGKFVNVASYQGGKRLSMASEKKKEREGFYREGSRGGEFLGEREGLSARGTEVSRLITLNL